jgi:hypothetical protein
MTENDFITGISGDTEVSGALRSRLLRLLMRSLFPTTLQNPELLPAAPADCPTCRGLTKSEEEETIIINRPGRFHLSRREICPFYSEPPLSASKIGADMMAESFVRSFDMPIVVLRPFNTYGPRQSERAIVPTLIRQFLDPNCQVLKVGDTTTGRDFTIRYRHCGGLHGGR